MRVLIILFILLITPMAWGDLNLHHVTINDEPYSIHYTGIKGVLIDEYIGVITKEWSHEITLRYHTGMANESEINAEAARMYNTLYDVKVGWWWKRPWWRSLESSPRRALCISGPTGDLINIGPVRVTNKFKFKLKTYEADLSGIYVRGIMHSGWKFKLRPSANIIFRSPIIKRLAVGLSFIYILRRRPVVIFDVNFGYKYKYNEFYGEIICALVQW